MTKIYKFSKIFWAKGIAFIARQFCIYLFRFLQLPSHFLMGSAATRLMILINPDENTDLEEVFCALKFYVPEYDPANLVMKERLSFIDALSIKSVLLTGKSNLFETIAGLYRPNTYSIDGRYNPKDAWAWCDLANDAARTSPDVVASQQRFIAYIEILRQEKFDRCYVFGTGPSLEAAIEKTWDDGYRIVCNTIVRDRELWHHLKPHFIVAGDALYHFSNSLYATAFRKDLRERLEESNTYFLYPAVFDTIVKRDLGHLSSRLLPIPSGRHFSIEKDLTSEFQLPSLGNVLSLLLLPLACTISKQIYLHGFDGRAPSDKLFWANSSKHSYPEYIPDLTNQHSEFFQHHVPDQNPTKYIKENMGEQLEFTLSAAEEKGWRFTMLHPSWTPALQNRLAKD